MEDQTDRVAPLESVSQPILNNGGGGDAMSIQATQRAGSDPQGTANVLPMTSLGSLDTAASMPGFGRPTIANYSQVQTFICSSARCYYTEDFSQGVMVSCNGFFF